VDRGGAAVTSAPAYAFRDSDPAAERLALLAQLFDPVTRDFVATCGLYRPGLAVDLGCGTGHTTRLLASTLRPARTVGLDSSRAFLARAAQDSPTLAFVEHDVAATPFPTGRADVVLCRLVLAHLPDPVRRLERWAAELRPRGRILVEEVERIDTDDAVFARYLDAVRDVLARRDAGLEVGPVLAAAEPRVLCRRLSRVVTVRPDTSSVARMFALNLETWRDEIEPDVAAELAAGLRAGRRGSIVWRLRQIVDEEASE
jgi:trans-aconitate 2-methyltransferase